MTPWESSKTGTGTIFDYLQLFSLEKADVKDEIIESQCEILKTLDDYNHLAGKIKEDQDSAKVGEFIKLKEILSKTETLHKLSSYLKKINENSHIFIKKLSEKSPGNQIYVEQEFQSDFFQTIEIIKDSSLLKIANQANNIHDSTKARLSTALSVVPSLKSEEILEEIYTKAKELSLLTNKY